MRRTRHWLALSRTKYRKFITPIRMLAATRFVFKINVVAFSVLRTQDFCAYSYITERSLNVQG